MVCWNIHHLPSSGEWRERQKERLWYSYSPWNEERATELQSEFPNHILVYRWFFMPILSKRDTCKWHPKQDRKISIQVLHTTIIIWLVVWIFFFHMLRIMWSTDQYFSEGLTSPTSHLYIIHYSARSSSIIIYHHLYLSIIIYHHHLSSSIIIHYDLSSYMLSNYWLMG